MVGFCGIIYIIVVSGTFDEGWAHIGKVIRDVNYIFRVVFRRNTPVCPREVFTVDPVRVSKNEVMCFQYLGTRVRMNGPSLVNCTVDVCKNRQRRRRRRHRATPPRMNSH